MNASRRKTTSSVFNIFQQNFPPDKLSLYFREKRSKILGNFVQSAGQFCYSNRQTGKKACFFYIKSTEICRINRSYFMPQFLCAEHQSLHSCRRLVTCFLCDTSVVGCSCLEIRMTQHILHGFQVRTALQGQGSRCVPQIVW